MWVSSKKSLSKSLAEMMPLCGNHNNNHYLLMVPLSVCVATNHKPSTAFPLQHISEALSIRISWKEWNFTWINVISFTPDLFPALCAQNQSHNAGFGLRKRLRLQLKPLLPFLIADNRSVPKSRVCAKWLRLCIAVSWSKDVYFCFIFLTMSATV